MDESWSATERLRRSREYQHCYRAGRRRTGRLFILYFLENEFGTIRVGVTASRKVGAAVVRHRLKRWTREVLRRWPERRALPPMDLVIHMNPVAAQASFGEFRLDLQTAIQALRPGRGSRSAPPRAS